MVAWKEETPLDGRIDAVQKTPSAVLLRNAMQENIDRVRHMANRAEKIADHLTGPAPIGGDDPKDGFAPDGFLSEMRDYATTQRLALERIDEALGRLEREFDV